MSSLKSSNKGLIILISSIACIVLSLGISLAVVLSTRANAFTTSNISRNTVTVGELWNSSSNSFNTNNATTLIHMLSNSSSGTIDNIYNNIGSSAINASTIRGYTTGKSSGQSIIVTLGGIQWTAMYLSKTKQDDVILTLWQSDATKKSTFGNSSSYYGANSTTGIPTAMYGTSYIRAVTLNNGGNYVNITSNSSNPTSASLSATPQSDHEYALFTHLSSQLRQYIVQPQYVSWQESGQSAKTTLGWDYNVSNENWSTSVSDDGFYNSGYNYAHKSGSDAWKTDYLWLPSMTETGYSGSAHGLWGTNQNERSNSLASCWSRSSYNLYTRYVYYLYADGSNGLNYYVDGSYAVRPALHLNLSSIIASIPASVGELWNSSSNSFNTNNATTLIHMLSNSSSGTIDNIYNNISSSAINASTIRGYTTGKSSGQSIIVTLGGIQWTAMYLSKTKQDDVILTLWQSDATKTSTFGNSSSYYGEDITTEIPTAMYGTSYIRAVTLNNGGNYVNITSNIGNPTSASLSATSQSNHEYALFTHSSSQLRQYIVQPQYVSWQESGQSAKTTLGWGYNVSNENWSTSVSDDGFFTSGRNYAHISGSDAWKTDYLWLPSMTETGLSGSAHGLWGTNQNERSNSLTSCWSRSSSPNYTHRVYYLNADGSLSNSYFVNSSYAVRPALHLNLTLIGYRLFPVTVQLDNQGGSGDSAVEVMRESAMPTVTIPSRTGYTFNGYFSGTNGTGDKYYNSNGTSAKVYPLENSPKILYAYWTPIHEVNISIQPAGSGTVFMLLDGSVSTLSTVDYDTELTLVAAPTSNFAFVQWQINGMTLTNEQLIANPLTITVRADIEVVAIFADALISGVNVSATYGGTVRLVGDNFDSLADTDHVILVADVCVDGYRFSHWENLDGESLGTANSIRLTKAQVMDNVITAVFVLDDGTYKDNVNLDKDV